jgi:hypothetical protein
MVSEEPQKSDGIEVRTTRSVLPHHFWIGVYTEPPVEEVHSEKLGAASSQSVGVQ